MTTEKFTASDIVITALHNSELLLSHATEHGLDIDKELVKTLIDAKYHFENSSWNRTIEIEFWIAFKMLTKLIQPVSVDSLNASNQTVIKKPQWYHRIFNIKSTATLMHRSARTYTFFTLLVMLILLIIHIYFFMGTTRLNQIRACDVQLKELEKRSGELMILLSTDRENKSASFEKERLDNEILELNSKKLSNLQLLEPWVDIIRKITFNKRKPETTAVGAPPDPMVGLTLNTSVLQESQNYLLILGLYILPLFFGLVGAFAFVLRELTREIKDLTFSKETNVKYILRLQLGALAGLAIGMFWGDLEKHYQFGLSSLSTLLIAFIAGYGVEYVFSFIESTIGSFLRKRIDKQAA